MVDYDDELTLIHIFSPPSTLRPYRIVWYRNNYSVA